ncbi:MAG: hypothetical protein RBQ97_10100 [Acholeplasma sp.]|nr:hypothetical protein [Acholeplasma sp.]
MTNQEISYLIYNDKIFNASKKQLMEYYHRENDTLPSSFYNDLLKIKEKSILSNNQSVAKATWCLETIGHIQDCFISAFIFMRDDYFYKGWCQLIECDTLIRNLDKHFSDKTEHFGIEHIRFQVNQFQKIFPYTLFISLAFKTNSILCSICNQKITPRNYCGHEVGEIYNGDLCFRYYKEIEPNHILICYTPKHKYAVLFTETSSYNYAAVKCVIDHVRSPWNSWDCEKSAIGNNISHYQINFHFEKNHSDKLLHNQMSEYTVSTDPKEVTFLYLYQISSKCYMT